jgi:hypothetical protein
LGGLKSGEARQNAGGDVLPDPLAFAAFHATGAFVAQYPVSGRKNAPLYA